MLSSLNKSTQRDPFLSLLQRSALVLALLAAATIPSTAKAQTYIYGSIDLTNYGYSSVVAGTSNYSPTGNNFSYNSDNLGLEGGATFFIPSRYRFKAGLDLHETYSIGHGGGNSGLPPPVSPSCLTATRSHPTSSLAAATSVSLCPEDSTSSSTSLETSRRSSTNPPSPVAPSTWPSALTYAPVSTGASALSSSAAPPART